METPRHFVQLWHHTTADQNLREARTLGHAASEQFHRVRSGDTVWVVTVYPPGELVLLGRLRVGVRTDQEGAERRLGTDDVWEARYHVIAEPGSEQPLREVNLMGVAADLRRGRQRCSKRYGRPAAGAKRPSTGSCGRTGT